MVDEIEIEIIHVAIAMVEFAALFRFARKGFVAGEESCLDSQAHRLAQFPGGTGERGGLTEKDVVVESWQPLGGVSKP